MEGREKDAWGSLQKRITGGLHNQKMLIYALTLPLVVREPEF